MSTDPAPFTAAQLAIIRERWQRRVPTEPDGPASVIQGLLATVTALEAERDQYAAVVRAHAELADAAVSWVTKDYLTDPSQGGLERVKRVERLRVAAQAIKDTREAAVAALPEEPQETS